jgi:hypothetical protein
VDRAAFLSGKLTLDIHGAEGIESITVFEGGNISEGWSALGCRTEEDPTQIYFGFDSTRKYLVADEDCVDMVLLVPEDLAGVGPHTRGILGAGEYRSSNTVKVFFTDDERAFLREKEWAPQWDLYITDYAGWMEDREAEAELTDAQ